MPLEELWVPGTLKSLGVILKAIKKVRLIDFTVGVDPSSDAQPFFGKAFAEWNILDGSKGSVLIQCKLELLEFAPQRETYPKEKWAAPTRSSTSPTVDEGAGFAYRIMPAERWRRVDVRVLKLTLNNTQKVWMVGQAQSTMARWFNVGSVERPYGIQYGDWVLFRNKLAATVMEQSEYDVASGRMRGEPQAGGDADGDGAEDDGLGDGDGAARPAVPPAAAAAGVARGVSSAVLETFIAAELGRGTRGRATLYATAKAWGFKGNCASVQAEAGLIGQKPELALYKMSTENLAKLLRWRRLADAAPPADAPPTAAPPADAAGGIPPIADALLAAAPAPVAPGAACPTAVAADPVVTTGAPT
eukprot:1277836-Prymnesium_polylepis.1